MASQVGIFNSGLDQSIVIIDNTTNAPINLGGSLETFEHSQLIEDIIAKPISGLVMHRQDYSGHDLKIGIIRQQGQLDLLTAQMEAEFYAQIKQRTFTVTETIANQYDGTTTTITFSGCTLSVRNHGNFARDSATKTEITVWAQTFTVTGG